MREDGKIKFKMNGMLLSKDGRTVFVVNQSPVGKGLHDAGIIKGVPKDKDGILAIDISVARQYIEGFNENEIPRLTIEK